MPQLHLYVPEELATELARRARARGLSVSRYLAELIRGEVCTSWPAGYFDQVVAGWNGDPLERPVQGELEARDRL